MGTSLRGNRGDRYSCISVGEEGEKGTKHDVVVVSVVWWALRYQLGTWAVSLIRYQLLGSFLPVVLPLNQKHWWEGKDGSGQIKGKLPSQQ